MVAPNLVGEWVGAFVGAVGDLLGESVGVVVGAEVGAMVASSRRSCSIPVHPNVVRVLGVEMFPSEASPEVVIMPMELAASTTGTGADDLFDLIERGQNTECQAAKATGASTRKPHMARLKGRWFKRQAVERFSQAHNPSRPRNRR